MLQKCERDSPGDFVDQVKVIKNQIYEFQIDNFNGSKIRSKAKLLDKSEKPSKYFFKLEASRGRKKLISKIEENSKTYVKTDDILDQFRTFYSKLFSTEGIDPEMCNLFLQDLPKLSDLNSSILDEPFT